MVKLLFFFILFIGIIRTYGKFDDLKDKHNLGQLTNNEIQYLSKLQDWDEFKKDLGKILIPRVVGTKGHTEVYEYIKNTLEQLNYNVEIDLFADNTPFGNLTFKNIIATLNPESERFFVIAAHYDSKYFQNGKFVGATDSAVPCAMMLQLAKVFKNFNFPKKEDVSLKLIFFDGEEAFVNWGPKDSIYGAKHLAVKMQRGRSRSSSTGEMVNDLQRIDCLMLLDLLGASNPKFYNYFDDTEELYTMLANSEKKLYQLGLLKRTSSPYFIKRTRNSYIEDDHIPFYQRNVPILHVIPTPFPDAWHTVHDNDDILDPDVIQDLGLTIQLFVARYLHIHFVPEKHTEL